jgi:hypothetical protein
MSDILTPEQEKEIEELADKEIAQEKAEEKERREKLTIRIADILRDHDSMTWRALAELIMKEIEKE